MQHNVNETAIDPATGVSTMPRIPVILDTDIGTDADDAACLAYLLRQPACELAAVTTVGADAPGRAAQVRMLCDRLGQPDVPVAAGADEPICPSLYWHEHRFLQKPVLERWPAEETFARGEALPLMRRVIRERPGEITLLCVGPMSNAALLAAADPETAAMLKGIVIMGGQYPNSRETPRTDCNVMLDAAATGTIFAFPWRDLLAAGLDFTGGFRLSLEEMEEHFGTELLEPVLESCRIWAQRHDPPHMGLHDPLTAALIFEPGLADYQRGRITWRFLDYMPRNGEPIPEGALNGAPLFEPDPAGPHRIAVQTDPQRLQAHLLEILCR